MEKSSVGEVVILENTEEFSAHLVKSGFSERMVNKITTEFERLSSILSQDELNKVLLSDNFEKKARELLIKSNAVDLENIGKSISALQLYRLFCKKSHHADEFPLPPVRQYEHQQDTGFSKQANTAEKGKLPFDRAKREKVNVTLTDIGKPVVRKPREKSPLINGQDRTAPKPSTIKQTVLTVEPNENGDILHPEVGYIKYLLNQQDTDASYRAKQDMYTHLFTVLAPENKKREDVLVKVFCLADNMKLPMFDYLTTVEQIVSLDIDEALRVGDEMTVNMIAEMRTGKSVRNNYVFAVKYCNCHFPEKYPIYNTDTDAALKYFRDACGFIGFENEQLKFYETYKRIICLFREKYGLESLSLSETARYLQMVGTHLKKRKPERD